MCYCGPQVVEMVGLGIFPGGLRGKLPHQTPLTRPKIIPGGIMAAFTGNADGDQSAAQTESKWKPGGRGRPPKSAGKGAPPPGNLPGNVADSDDVDGEEGSGEYVQRPGAPIPPDAYTLRRNPLTYPRRENGLPIPLYRVTRTEDDLHNYLLAMRPEDWGHCVMYVYREYPKAKPVQGEYAYIDKISQGPVDLLRLIETYGSGVYGFTLNDENVQGNRRTAMYAKVELTRENIPEMYDLETLDINHKNNRQLVARLQRDGILNSKGEVMADNNAHGMAQVVDKLTNALLEANKQNNRPAAPAAQDPNAAAMAAVHKTTVEMLGDANKAAIAAATAGNKSGGLGETLQLVTTLLAAMKPPDNSAMMTMLMEDLKNNREATRLAAEAAEKERQRNHELQMKALEQKATAADPLDQVEKFMKIKNLFGGGDGGAVAPRNWKEQGLAMLGDHLPQILEVGAAFAQSLGRPNPVTPAMVGGGGGAGGMGAMGGNQPGQVIDVQAQPAPQLQGQGQPQAQANPADDPTLTPEQQLQVQRIQTLQNQLMKHGAFLVNAIKRGQTGDQFAEFMINGTDDLTYARACGYSRDEYMMAIYSFPELQATFAGAEATVARFVDEFLAYGNGDGDDGDGGNGGDEPPAPPPPPPAPATATPTTTTRTRKGKA